MKFINSWKLQDARLPITNSNGVFLAYRNYMYMVCGTNALNASGIKDVWSAPISADGSLGRWKLVGGIPVIHGFHTACIHEGTGRLYVFGGTQPNPKLWMAKLDGEGGCGVFSIIDQWLTAFNSSPGMVAIGDAIVICEAATGRVRLHQIDGQSKYVAPLPAIRNYFHVVADKDNIYVIGGEDASTNKTATVYRAKVTNFDIPRWEVLKTTLPVGLARHGVVNHNGNVLIVNGRLQSLANTDACYNAQIQPDGTMSAFTAEDRHPIGFRNAHQQTVIYNGYIYTLGGFDTSYSDKVFISKLSAG